MFKNIDKYFWASLASITLFALLSLYIGIRLYSADHNTLDKRPWLSKKTLMARGLMGAQNNLETTNALRNESLDLSSWHGFQELYLTNAYKLPLNLKFDFQMEKDSYFSLLISSSTGVSQGLRLSRNKFFPPAIFEVDKNGKFLKKKELPHLKDEHLGSINCSINYQRIVCLVNGKEIAFLPNMTNLNPRLIGFRGSMEASYIDNIKILNPKGDLLLEEDFSYIIDPDRDLKTLLLYFFIAAILGLLLYGIFYKKEPKERFFSFLTSIIVVTSCSLITIFFLPLLKGAYPDETDEDLSSQKAWAMERAMQVKAHALDQFRNNTSLFQSVLILGGSQTWGSGARSENESLEVYLRKAIGEKFVVFNGGVGAFKSADILNTYFDIWDKIAPDYLIVNWGRNDDDPKAFKENSLKLIQLQKRLGKKIIFFLEGQSLEKKNQKDLKAMHKISMDLALEHDIPYVDMQKVFDDKADTGFLWWDHIHLTSYGQQILAREIQKIIMSLN